MNTRLLFVAAAIAAASIAPSSCGGNSGSPAPATDAADGHADAPQDVAAEIVVVASCAGQLDGTACQAACFSVATCLNGQCLVDPDSGVVCPAPPDPCISALTCMAATGECTGKTYVEAGASCDLDDDVCSLDVCDGVGSCVATAEVDGCVTENQNNPCWTYLCNKKSGCAKTNFVEGVSCNDNNPCTFQDICTYDQLNQESCVGSPVVTDDQNPCTDDTCVDGTVLHPPIDGTPCEASGPCPGPGLCVDGACEVAEACPCQEDADCDPAPGGCVGTSFCDTSGISPVCAIAPDSAVPCESPPVGACFVLQCDQATGGCVEHALPDGNTCDDGDPCTVPDICVTSACQAGGSVDCSDENPCTADTCDQGGCFHTSLEDGAICGAGKTCQDGACTDSQGSCLTWTAGDPSPKDIHYGPGIAKMGSIIYVLGGSPSFQHLIYQAGDGVWAEGQPLPGNGVTEGAAVVVGGKLYTVHNAFDENIRIFEVATSQWTVGAARPTGKGRAPAVGTDGTDVLVFGGSDGNLDASNEVHRYQPSLDAWSEETPMPTARGHAAFATVAMTVHVIGGRDSSAAADILDVHEAFDLTTSTWTSLAPMPTARNSAMAAAMDGKIYVAGGFDGQGVIATVEVYDVASDTWSGCTAMTTSRQSGVAVSHDGNLLVFGGGTGSDKKTFEIGSP